MQNALTPMQTVVTENYYYILWILGAKQKENDCHY